MLAVARILGQVAGTLADLQAAAFHVMPKDGSLAPAGLNQAEQELDGGALARPVGSQEAEDRVLPHGQAEALQGLSLFVDLAQVMRFNCQRIAGVRSSLSSSHKLYTRTCLPRQYAESSSSPAAASR